MEADEPVIVETTVVDCDGGGALGHPNVYLTMGSSDRVECPYCGRHFVRADDASRAAES